MQEAAFFIEVIKYVGFPALIFVIWHLYHKSTNENYKQIINSTVATFTQIIEGQAKREERNFNLLKDMLETNQYHGSLLAKIVEKIEKPVVSIHQRNPEQ